MKNITTEKKIKQFVALSENGVISFNKIGNEVIFPFTKKQFIKIEDNIRFFDGVNEKEFWLTRASFDVKKQSLDILYEIGSEFGLEKVLLRRDNFSYQFKSEKIYDYYLAIFKKYGKDHFCMIYGVRRERESKSMAEDMFTGNILFVFGIWKVKLSKEFEQELFHSED